MSAQEAAAAAPAAAEPKKEAEKPEKKTMKIYCLFCRCEQEVKDLSHTTTRFESKRKHIPMERESWVGACSVCGRRVSRFSKKEEASA